jgi:gamma-glutamyltranspeptidase / glutathione hydrolase
MIRRSSLILIALVVSSLTLDAGSVPFRAKRGMVVSQSDIASQIGFQVIRDGGNAVDAAVATAFALAVTHPAAGNIGGGGFLVFRSAAGEATTFDFREVAPAGSNPEMWLVNGKYNTELHHNSHRAVGVPGTVAGFHLAWKTLGTKPWKELVAPAIVLARDGFEVSDALARSLARTLDSFKKYPASMAQFSRNGVPYRAGEILKQPDLARTLERIANLGPAGFYEGETAMLLEKEMKANGGLITREDLKNYQAKQRAPIKGTYRGHEIIGMGPPSSGGISVQLMLNLLEATDLKANGYGSSQNLHLIAESMRRAFAERAQHLGDPDFVSTMPIDRLISKQYAAELRKTINPTKASKSSPSTFTWATESDQTTHFSIVDGKRNAVAVTYTLEASYGSKIVAPGTGFLLNNEMGDFNAGPGLTDATGLIGTDPNLARPGKRMLSSMSPTIVTKDDKLVMVTGSPGGRTIINTVLLTILNVIDFGMNAQEAVDAGRIHHQWLPDRISHEEFGFSADTIAALKAMGHTLEQSQNQGVAQVIVYNAADDMLEGGLDRRAADGGVGGK